MEPQSRRNKDRHPELSKRMQQRQDAGYEILTPKIWRLRGFAAHFTVPGKPSRDFTS